MIVPTKTVDGLSAEKGNQDIPSTRSNTKARQAINKARLGNRSADSSLTLGQEARAALGVEASGQGPRSTGRCDTARLAGYVRHDLARETTQIRA
jgi:hypothetical protein